LGHSLTRNSSFFKFWSAGEHDEAENSEKGEPKLDKEADCEMASGNYESSN